MESTTNTSASAAEELNMRDIISFVWNLRMWIILSVIVCLGAAFIYIRMATPMYQRSARLIIASNKTDRATSSILLSDLTGASQTSSTENEILILSSPSLMEKVVEELNLNTRYSMKYAPMVGTSNQKFNRMFALKTSEFYLDNPFSLTVWFDPLYSEQSRPKSVSVELTGIDSTTFKIKDLKLNGIEDNSLDLGKPFFFGQPVQVHGINLMFELVTKLLPGITYHASWSEPYKVAQAYASRISVEIIASQSSKQLYRSNAVDIKLTDSNPHRADDIINTLISKYNDENRAYNSYSLQSTVDFINGRLQDLSVELGTVESNYRQYQSKNNLVDIQTQSHLTLSSDMEYENQLTDLGVQTSILDMLRDELQKYGDSDFKVIPSNIGLSDPTLNQVISNYNTLVGERNRLISNSSVNNPHVKNVNTQLLELRNNIMVSTENLEKVYSLRQAELKNVLRRSKQKISDIPSQQFDLTQIERKQQIIEPLYILLQQKKEEAQISMYSQADNARIIESANGPTKPVSPQSKKIYLLAFLLGCCIPPAFVFARIYLKTTVDTRDDVEKVLSAPVISTIPKVDDPNIPIEMGDRAVKTESFRMLRSSLQFLPGQVIQVSSSIPGEGKSFIATNLAISIAHLGKTVALLGLDLRRPTLPDYFKDIEINAEESIVAYLAGKINDPSKTLYSYEKYPNLKIAFSKVVPPTPTELISSPRMEELMDYYRANFDYIICDSAPMLPVADSKIINKFVDTTLYVVRSGFTGIKLLAEVKRMFANDIKSPILVLNGVDLDSKIYRYGFGHSYGYSYGKGYRYGYNYGYGYGYGYGDEKDKKDGRKKRRH